MPEIINPPDSLDAAWTVLLADDNQVDQTLIIRLLERTGHTVVVADTGRAVLEAVKRQTFDLVLMDVQMQEMDGLDATVAIRRWEKTTGRHVPIIAITAIGDKESCLQSGMDGYIAKPILLTDVFRTIEDVLARLSLPPLAIGSPTPEGQPT
jgi:CheY-like chemotaxis protein